MRFFGSNELASYNEQTITASSGDPYLCFSDTTKFSYESEGQGADGDVVEFLQEFTYEVTLDTIVVLACNFADFKILTASGGSFTDITANATLLTSQSGTHRLYKFPSEISFTEIKFQVEDTITANEEKTVGNILGFTELGSILRFQSVKTTGKIKRKVNELDSGGVAVISKGQQHWDFSINSALISDQTEFDLIETLQARTSNFWFWINDGYDGNEKVLVEPYRFQDFMRCAMTGGSAPSHHKNFLNLAAKDQLKFRQTARIDYYAP